MEMNSSRINLSFEFSVFYYYNNDGALYGINYFHAVLIPTNGHTLGVCPHNHAQGFTLGVKRLTKNFT